MDMSGIFMRAFYSLAADLKYSLQESEIRTLIEGLGKHGLKAVKIACLAFSADERPLGSFPSLAEFERKINECR